MKFERLAFLELLLSGCERMPNFRWTAASSSTFMLVLFGAAFRSTFLPEENEEEIYSSDGPMHEAIGEVKLSKRR